MLFQVIADRAETSACAKASDCYRDIGAWALKEFDGGKNWTDRTANAGLFRAAYRIA